VSVPKSAAKKGSTVYAVKKINLYKSANFKAANKLATYAKRTRINRPKFVVTGYARSTNGALRYQVRAANGKKGYITAKASYVQPLYYQSVPKSKTITVIAKKGINAYKNSTLTGKVKHYKKGTQLKVKRLVKHHLATRYELSNGHFISGNKLLVAQGRY
jgi:alpha-N-acetylglucosamine transferase